MVLSRAQGCTQRARAIVADAGQSSAKGTVELKAGKSVTVKLGCEGGAADRSTSCPENLGSLHIGSDGKKTGCAIAISYKRA